jgi:hypothetical protein
VNASLRGEEAYSAADDPLLSPSLYVTFHTEELQQTARYALWVGVPVAYLLLSCCCCCVCCICCAVPDDQNKQAAEVDLADLADLEGELPPDQSWQRRRVDFDVGDDPALVSASQ